MEKFSYVISDRQGLHALNAMQLTKASTAYSCKIMVEKGSRRADCKNMLSLMGLGARQGDRLIFSIIGEDEEEAVSYLKALIPTIM